MAAVTEASGSDLEPASSRLPPELLIKIFLDLERFAIPNILQTCKLFYQLTKSTSFRLEYFFHRYYRFEVLYEIIGRSRMATPELLMAALERGAHLSQLMLYCARKPTDTYVRRHNSKNPLAMLSNSAMGALFVEASRRFGDADQPSRSNGFGALRSWLDAGNEATWKGAKQALEQGKYAPYSRSTLLCDELPLAIRLNGEVAELLVKNDFEPDDTFNYDVFQAQMQCVPRMHRTSVSGGNTAQDIADRCQRILDLGAGFVIPESVIGQRITLAMSDVRAKSTVYAYCYNCGMSHNSQRSNGNGGDDEGRIQCEEPVRALKLLESKNPRYLKKSLDSVVVDKIRHGYILKKVDQPSITKLFGTLELGSNVAIVQATVAAFFVEEECKRSTVLQTIESLKSLPINSKIVSQDDVVRVLLDPQIRTPLVYQVVKEDGKVAMDEEQIILEVIVACLFQPWKGQLLVELAAIVSDKPRFLQALEEEVLRWKIDSRDVMPTLSPLSQPKSPIGFESFERLRWEDMWFSHLHSLFKSYRKGGTRTSIYEVLDLKEGVEHYVFAAEVQRFGRLFNLRRLTIIPTYQAVMTLLPYDSPTLEVLFSHAVMANNASLVRQLLYRGLNPTLDHFRMLRRADMEESHTLIDHIAKKSHACIDVKGEDLTMPGPSAAQESKMAEIDMGEREVEGSSAARTQDEPIESTTESQAPQTPLERTRLAALMQVDEKLDHLRRWIDGLEGLEWPRGEQTSEELISGHTQSIAKLRTAVSRAEEERKKAERSLETAQRTAQRAAEKARKAAERATKKAQKQAEAASQRAQKQATGIKRKRGNKQALAADEPTETIAKRLRRSPRKTRQTSENTEAHEEEQVEQVL